MEMHELEQAWRALDARLERQDETLQALRRGRATESVRSRLRLVTGGQFVQLAIGAAIVLWAGGYWFDRLDQPHLVVYGVAIHLYGLALLVASVLQLTRLARLDYRQPVLALQRDLLAIRRLRAAGERMLLVLGMLVWVPVVFVALRGIGQDLWLTRPAVVLWNLAFGIGLALAAAWWTHRFPDRLDRDAAGRSLRDAQAELDEL